MHLTFQISLHITHCSEICFCFIAILIWIKMTNNWKFDSLKYNIIIIIKQREKARQLKQSFKGYIIMYKTTTKHEHKLIILKFFKGVSVIFR